MSDKNSKLWQEKQVILEKIRKEASYRPVVPFLGAGISVSAGFPTIKFVIQYLAKVDFAIQFGVFADRFPNIRDDQQAAVETYRRHPSKYLEDFGWPDLGQINADIWDWLEWPLSDKEKTEKWKKCKHKGVGRIKIWENCKIAAESLIKQNEERRKKDLCNLMTLPDLLAYDVTDKPILGVSKAIKNGPLELRDHLQAIIQWTLRKELAGREDGATRAILKEWLKWKQHYFNDCKNVSEPGLLYGDWEMLLDRLCEGNFNLADALFTSFESGLNPTLSHRHLAFLQPKLGIPLLLTTNFDSFLERAFQEEGIPPKVFDIHRNAELPDATLVRRQLSLLKLHGSAYGLRLGERLKYPLEADARSSALGYIPTDALVLVMGFNGSERRMMQMLQAFAREKELGADKPRLIWIQGPGEPGPLFKELVANSVGNVQCCRVGHIDTFLQELYFYITSNSYHSPTIGYSTIPSRPLTTGLKTVGTDTYKDKQQKRRPVHLCIADIDNNPRSSNWSSLAGMAFVNSLDNGYTVIWIDLENHHTVEGIIAEFFSRVRVVDPRAPSCTITNMDDDPSAAISKAIERIRDVFKRGRYVLVLDLVESFGRPQMVHHGIPSSYKNPDDKEHGANSSGQQKEMEEMGRIFQGRVKNLKLFLSKLLYIERGESPELNYYWDSYVVVTADMPRLRHLQRIDEPKPWAYTCVNKKLVKLLQGIEGLKYNHIHVHRQKKMGYEELIADEKFRPSNDPSKYLSPHWRHDENKNKVEQSAYFRAENVLSLLSVLRSNDKVVQKTKKLRLKPTTEPFVCLLSVFRRPRSLPLLRSIIERWGLRKIGDESLDDEVSLNTHKAINELLQLIATNRSPVGVVSQNHEGGNVWLFREVYEATYDALTEHLHAQEWLDFWDPKKANGPYMPSSSAAIMDGILAITWHLFAARAYYVDVFLSTHDIRAFYEYLYHRVSAIKTIALLITIIEKDNESAIFIDLNKHCEKLFAEHHKELLVSSEKLDPFEWYTLVLGVFDHIKLGTNKISVAGQLVRNLKLLRKHALDTLLMALTKNKLLFRSEATPDTVLAWSKQFLEHELKNMRQIEIDGSPIINFDQDDPELNVKETIGELHKQFERLKSQAQLSKMDYKNILGNCRTEEDFRRKEAVFTETVRDLISSSDSGFKEKFDLAKKKLDEFFNVARCLVHPCDPRAQACTESILNALSGIKTTKPEIEFWVKTNLRDAFELSCRSRFNKWSFWQPLLERSESHSRKELEKAEQHSVLYEDLLRETTKTNDDDVKHRSTALTIRARALYLRGHFPQAHHFLDLASTGFFPERLNHRPLICVVHIVRAELLAISAHEHYFSLSKHDQVRKVLAKPNVTSNFSRQKQDSIEQTDSSMHGQHLELRNLPRKFTELADALQPIASSSLKKIERAEQELHHAEKLLRSMAHQNIWLIHMEFGWAQVQVERMLFEMERLFLAWPSLTVTQYLQRSGDLEQKILDAMQRLRNVFDTIPYQSCSWDDMKKDEEESGAGRSMFQIECSTYKLWRQLFVVGAYYSSLLNCLYRGVGSIHVNEETTIFDIAEQVIPCLAGLAITGNTAVKYREQWRLWCFAMRFDNFGSDENMMSFNLLNSQSKESLKSVSFRAVVIDAMLLECEDKKIKKMWTIRRIKKEETKRGVKK